MSDVARLSANPTEENWIAVKRIMRYLNGTRDMGLLYDGSKTTNSCVGYSDADWAGDLDDRKSTSGYVFQISNAAISWAKQKNSHVCLSRLLKQNTWHWQVQPKKQSVYNNF